MHFNLNYRDFGSRHETRHSDHAYDYTWSHDHCYDYHSATIAGEDECCDISLFPGEAEPKVGDTIYVVCVSYDTGDSFGRETGLRNHLWAFSNQARAWQLAEAIADDAEASPEYNFNHKPLMFCNVPIATNEWKGYFESFNAAGVESVVILKNR